MQSTDVCDYCEQVYSTDGHALWCGEFLNDAGSPLMSDGSIDRTGYPDSWSDGEIVRHYRDACEKARAANDQP